MLRVSIALLTAIGTTSERTYPPRPVSGPRRFDHNTILDSSIVVLTVVHIRRAKGTGSQRQCALPDGWGIVIGSISLKPDPVLLVSWCKEVFLALRFGVFDEAGTFILPEICQLCLGVMEKKASQPGLDGLWEGTHDIDSFHRLLSCFPFTLSNSLCLALPRGGF